MRATEFFGTYIDIKYLSRCGFQISINKCEFGDRSDHENFFNSGDVGCATGVWRGFDWGGALRASRRESESGDKSSKDVQTAPVVGGELRLVSAQDNGGVVFDAEAYRCQGADFGRHRFGHGRTAIF